MSCSHTSNCPLFAQFAMEPSLTIWKSHYCEGDNSKCARYQMGLKGDAVPITLLPNGRMIEKKVKTKEELGGTALFNAILKNRASMVKSMFVSGMSSVNIVSNDGSTPLMAAASIGSLEIVNILLEAGCNPYRTNQIGINALTVAEKKNFPECASVIKQFMEAHPELEAKALSEKANTKAAVQSEHPEEKESGIKEVVGLLKKLNPFSR